MGSIAQSLMVSHKRAQGMKEHGYVPTSMLHVIEHADAKHDQFEHAIDVLRDSTKAYHEQKGKQRTALEKMNEAVERGKDATERLDDHFDHGR